MYIAFYLIELNTIICLILLFIAGFANACMDVLTHKHSSSVFKKLEEKYGYFWSDAMNESWKNKYVDRDPTKGRIYWKIFNFKIKKPVLFTDAWHLAKSIMLTSISAGIAVVLFSPAIRTDNYVLLLLSNVVIVRTVFGFAFALFYNKLLRTK